MSDTMLTLTPELSETTPGLPFGSIDAERANEARARSEFEDRARKYAEAPTTSGFLLMVESATHYYMQHARLIEGVESRIVTIPDGPPPIFAPGPRAANVGRSVVCTCGKRFDASLGNCPDCTQDWAEHFRPADPAADAPQSASGDTQGASNGENGLQAAQTLTGDAPAYTFLNCCPNEPFCPCQDG